MEMKNYPRNYGELYLEIVCLLRISVGLGHNVNFYPQAKTFRLFGYF